VVGEHDHNTPQCNRPPLTGVPPADSPLLPLRNELRLAIEYVPREALHEPARRLRRHPKRQLQALRRSIDAHGFLVPLITDEGCTIIAGRAAFAAGCQLGMTEFPVIRLTHLSADQLRAFTIAHNRLAELSEWDDETLALELKDLVALDFDVTLTGFEVAEIDLRIAAFDGPGDSAIDDHIPDMAPEPVSRSGDVWVLGPHRIACGDARDPAAYRLVLGDDGLADIVFTDPPYNVSINDHAGGKGSTRHPEFVMASGEMTEAEYAAFLDAFVRQSVAFSRPGSLHYLCIDWRHLPVLHAVCARHYDCQLNLCVWAKPNGGMGSLYRSRHELVLVSRHGDVPHRNNVELGRHGRNRTNVWEYEGVNTLSPGRRADLALHPTVKPVGLVADAILDCTARGDIVLDPFLGSGTTLVAAEKTGRAGRGLELDPRYVDVAVRRLEEFTGRDAVHAASGLTFTAEAEARRRDRQEGSDE